MTLRITPRNCGDLSTKLESVEQGSQAIRLALTAAPVKLRVPAAACSDAWDDWNDFVTAEQELVDMKVITDFLTMA